MILLYANKEYINRICNNNNNNNRNILIMK